mgnify:CR=1 FL=1
MSTSKWAFDASHSELGFKIKHLMISTVSGLFSGFNVDLNSSNDDFTDATVNVTIDVATINTKNAQRDGHLLTTDFFETEKYPNITYQSTRFEKTGDAEYILHGNLTIKEVTQPIDVKVEFNGLAKDPWGNIKAGFTISGKINRKDFGLNWNAALETGGVMVSEEVRINSEIQLVKAN